MAGSIAKAYVQVIPSAQGIKGKLSGMLGGEASAAGDSAGGSFASSLLSKAKGLIATAGLGKMLGESLSAGGALQQSLGGVETLFKDSAATVIANAEKAYKTAGMSANQYMETVTGFSASLLQSLGGDTVAAAAYADRALVDMADNVNKFGSSAETVQNAYMGFAKQNYTMLDNLKLGYGGTKEEMQRLIKDAASLTDVQKEMGITVDANSMSFGNIVNAISVMQKQMGIAGATSAEAATTFSGSMASMKAAFSDLLANLSTGRDIGPSLSALGETVKTFLVDNLLPMVGNILQQLPQVISSTVSMAGSIFTEAAPLLLSSLSDCIVSCFPMLLSTGQQLLGTVVSGITSALPSLVEAGASTAETYMGQLFAALPEVLSVGGEMLNTLVSGIASALPSLTESALQLTVSFANQLIASLPQILSTGKSILLSVVRGIQTALPSILASAGEAVGTLLTGIIQNLPSIIAAGYDLVASLITGLGNAAPDCYAGAVSLFQNIRNAMKSINWVQVGCDIVRGIINGVGSMYGALWSAARNLAKAAFNSIKSALGIASPSKVMRDQVGKWIPSGVAVGIKANTKPLSDAMHDVAALTTDTLQTDIRLESALRYPLSYTGNLTAASASGREADVVDLLRDIAEGNAARQNTEISLLRELIQAVMELEIGDEVLGKAVERYNHKKQVAIGAL